MCAVTSLIYQARVATLDRATHSSDCARLVAGRVVVAAVVAVVVAARVCVCVRVCEMCLFRLYHHS